MVEVEDPLTEASSNLESVSLNESLNESAATLPGGGATQNHRWGSNPKPPRCNYHKAATIITVTTVTTITIIVVITTITIITITIITNRYGLRRGNGATRGVCWGALIWCSVYGCMLVCVVLYKVKEGFVSTPNAPILTLRCGSCMKCYFRLRTLSFWTRVSLKRSPCS